MAFDSLVEGQNRNHFQLNRIEILFHMDDYRKLTEESLIELLAKYTTEYTHVLKTNTGHLPLKSMIDGIVTELYRRKAIQPDNFCQSESEEIFLN